jgi:hypothetical protein
MMSDGLLTFDDGIVQLAGARIPGILKSLSIAGQVRFDEAEQDGLSGKVKVPMGWTDADITLVVELTTESGLDCYDKLAQINATFKGTDNGGNPKVFDVVNRHAIARGIERVVFAGLGSRETDEDDVILADLAFVEHVPPVTKIEERVSASGGQAPETTALEPELDSSIMVDLS